MTVQRYADRTAAGKALAAKLRSLGYADRADVLVLGLPRGGIPVAFEVATALHAPLDVFVVRKLGTPGHEELAMGAIATGGVRVINPDVISMLGISNNAIERAAAEEQAELTRREQLYRGSRPPADVRGRSVILIDDGLATGASMRAAITALRRLAPAHITVAVPVAAEDTCDQITQEVDEMVCLMTPPFFQAVGQWYEEFSQTSDAEVRKLLASATPPAAGAASQAGFISPPH